MSRDGQEHIVHLLREMVRQQEQTNRLLRKSLGIEQEELQVAQAEDGFLSQIEDELRHNFSVGITQLQGDNMALGTIAPGSTGQFGAVLLNNGAPDTSGFVPTFTFTTSDPSATVAAATTDASGGTIPLANQSVVSIPTGDTLGSVVVTASCVDPNGATQSGSVSVAIGGGTTPPTNVFSVGVTQLA
jgi:hypothetical protein